MLMEKRMESRCSSTSRRNTLYSAPNRQRDNDTVSITLIENRNKYENTITFRWICSYIWISKCVETAVFGRALQKLIVQMSCYMIWVEISVVVADEVQDGQEADVEQELHKDALDSQFL